MRSASGFQHHFSVKIPRGGIRAGNVMAVLLLLAAGSSACFAAGTNGFSTGDFSAMVADRTAVEKIYYNHRLGAKPAFEEVLPPAMVKQLVNRDLKKESTLKKVCGVEITDRDIETESDRINNSTRAPDVLAELKAALGNDPVRFGRSVVKPILVERRLHECFEKDVSANASERDKAGQLRARILAAGQNNASLPELMEILRNAGTPSEITWQLEAGKQKPAQSKSSSPPVPMVAGSSNYSVEATVQVERVFPDAKPHRETLPFSELRSELQALLQAQLQKPGDISAVVETQDGFWLFLTRERTDRILGIASLCIPKQNYESWLEQQTRPSAQQAASK